MILYIYIYIRKVKLVTRVEKDPKTPFSLATTPRCKRRHNSFPWIALLYPWSIPYYAELLRKVASSTIFWVFDIPAHLWYWPIDLVGSMFTNNLGRHGSIPGRVILKTQKWYLMLPRLSLIIRRYGSRVKWSNPGKGVVSSPSPQYSSYWKGSLWVTLYNGCQIYLDIYIYTYLFPINCYTECMKFVYKFSNYNETEVL